VLAGAARTAPNTGLPPACPSDWPCACVCACACRLCPPSCSRSCWRGTTFRRARRRRSRAAAPRSCCAASTCCAGRWSCTGAGGRGGLSEGVRRLAGLSAGPPRSHARPLSADPHARLPLLARPFPLRPGSCWRTPWTPLWTTRPQRRASQRGEGVRRGLGAAGHAPCRPPQPTPPHHRVPPSAPQAVSGPGWSLWSDRDFSRRDILDYLRVCAPAGGGGAAGEEGGLVSKGH
jgi:hypothetical protein